MSVGTKLVARAVASRLQMWLAEYLPEEQMAFRGGRGVDGALQVSRRVNEEVLNTKGDRKIVISRCGIETPYPIIRKWALWRLLQHWGMPNNMLAVVQALHEFTAVKVRIYGGKSSLYTTERGYAHHTAAMADSQGRRKETADRTGLTPGFNWTTKVDGKLRRPHQERRLKSREGRSTGTGI